MMGPDHHPHQCHHGPQNGGKELARRFADRAGAVDNADGFEGFFDLRLRDVGPSMRVNPTSLVEPYEGLWCCVSLGERASR